MIRYALACEAGHDFESWFPSATSYDQQALRGLVECPVCGSAKVDKRLMAPSLGRGAKKGALAERTEDAERAPSAEKPAETAADAPAMPVPAPPQPGALLSEREQAMRSMLRAIREHVTQNSDYVGAGFANEARKMHYGETPHRSIYGEANPGEAKALMEEGIEVQPLPIMPDDRN